MPSERAFYITTPIYYVNDVPHIGHAYTTIAADTLALYHRMAGDRVLFCTGTDEHGQKIQTTAEAKGMTSQELADRTVENFRRLWEVLHITHDDFIRTTEPRHERVVQAIFNRLLEKGDIYKGTYEGLYCVPCETYVPESQMGEGRTCPDCKRPLKPMTEESYFFRISRYQEALLRFYEENPEAIQPRSRYNEVVSFIRGGLNDQSVSRTTLKWGIPVPGDERHVVYVWFDALINYLTVCGYPDDETRMAEFWPSVHHLVGKDIIRFHCVVWPAMLLALGLNPPKKVFAHGWWTVEGEKMSKSKGNVVDPFEMVDLYGVDAFRYVLLREVAFGNDGDFSELALVQRINSDLANDLGNLLNRTLQMVERFQGGKVLAAAATDELDRELLRAVTATFEAYREAMERFAFDEALKALWTLIGRGNKYIDTTMPWKLGKEGQTEHLAAVLSTLCTVLRLAALCVAPVMPEVARTVWRQLGLEGSPEEAGFAAADRPFPEGVTVAKGDVLVPRIDIEAWKEAKAAREVARNLDPDPGEHEEEIAIDDFRKVELRVARIVAAEAVPKADKLFRIDVDLGYERRTIVSGIREYYKAEDLVGKTIIVVCNLKPVKLRGVESRGMLLAAESCRDDGLALLTVDGAMALGSRIH